MNNEDYRYPHLEKDEEFMFLIQPSSQAAYSKLQERLLDEGCTEPIIVWHGLIVDGHKRYDICRRWSIPYSIRQSRCNSRAEVYSFICEEQLQRDDLSSEMRKYLIGRMYQAEADKRIDAYSRKKQEEHKSGRPVIPGKAYTKLTIAQYIADRFEISSGTVLKYDSYAKCLNNLREKDSALVDKILSGQLRVSHENIVELDRLPASEIQALNKAISENRITKIGYSEIRHELQWKYTNTYQPKRKKKPVKEKEEIAPIKKMPVHDPDSDLSSVALTAPSWVSILDRARTQTDFKAASRDAKDKTLQQLKILKTSIYELEAALKEEDSNGGSIAVRPESTLRADSDQEPGFKPELSAQSVYEACPEGGSQLRPLPGQSGESEPPKWD